MESPKLHVVIFPSAGLGHLTPFAEFAKRLSECHGLSVTFMTCQWMFSSHLIAAFSERMASASLGITFVQLPGDVEIEGAEHIKTETRISMAMEKSTGLVDMGLRSLFDSGSPVSVFITDFFCSAMFDVTAKLSIPTYVFFTSPASMLPLMFSMPKIVLETPISFKDADFPVKAPGLPPISSRDLPTPLQDRSDEVFFWFMHHFLRLREIKGVLINTFEELETEPIKALVEGNISINPTFGHRIPRVYPVGPVISSSPLESRDKLLQDRRVDCLDWLDQQPPSSVLFVSFGSGGALPKAQVTEIALGLEASRHRFLWVLRSASERIFQSSKETDLSQLLPEGFQSRNRDRGLVVPSWVPQVPVLSHPSTGGFLCHCGWNSTLESISHGVPVITWPLFAEQRLNKFLLVNEFKVAIETEMESDGFVGREEVERVVRELMEGEGGRRVRARVRDLKEKAMTALDAGGSSYTALAAAVSEWRTSAEGCAGINPSS
nr:UGT2 [Pinus yunnanensis]